MSHAESPTCCLASEIESFRVAYPLTELVWQGLYGIHADFILEAVTLPAQPGK